MKKSIMEKIDENFYKELNKIALTRIKNDLEEDKISIRELTRMTLNANSWNNLKEELESKPRKQIE